jgi:hypothetical protein
MPRKPTGRPRGRPAGSRQYPGDDKLCVELARRVLAGTAAPLAARQLEAEFPDQRTKAPGTKAKRLMRNYGLREQWFLIQARPAPPPVSPPARRAGLAAAMDSMTVLQRMAEEQDRLIRQLEEPQRLMARMAKLPWLGAN